MAPDVAFEAALTWSLVIPVKVLAQAKSRLTGLAGQLRSELALAMVADTVAVALGADSVAAVIVVTDDPDVRELADGLGAIVLADRPAAGLNQALSYGAGYSEARWPERGRAGLAGDLPAARPRELTSALAAAAGLGAAFVPDADGTGTTLYAAAPSVEFRPQFGAASRDRHLAAGAAEIGPKQLAARLDGTDLDGTDLDGTDLDLAGLRRDVDTLDDLRRAAAIGLGPRTLALLSADGIMLRWEQEAAENGHNHQPPGH